MTFEALVDRLTAAFDVTQTHAVDVVNERLGDMVAKSTALRAVVTLGTTVANQSSYALAANVVKILQAKATYTSGTVIYEGVSTLEDLWGVDALDTTIDGNVIAIEADSDSLATTDNFRIYPTPTVSGVVVTGLVAIRPAVLTYTSGTALPIPVDQHPALLDGAKAELFDEEGRQDEAAKHDASFQIGVKALESGVNKRGKGSTGTRLRLVGYDLNRR